MASGLQLIRSRTFVFLIFTVGISSLFLALLFFTFLDAETARKEYQRRERQIQIARLLEADLKDSLLFISSGNTPDTLGFEYKEETLSLPRFNITCSPFFRLKQSELDRNQFEPLARAQRMEPTRRDDAETAYRSLLGQDPDLAALARLGLLRTALAAGNPKEANAWLGQIMERDEMALAAYGIPVWIAAALLVTESGPAQQPETSFLENGCALIERTTRNLAAGRWPLSPAQWILYVQQLKRSEPRCAATMSGLEEAQSMIESIDRLTPQILQSLRVPVSPVDPHIEYFDREQSYVVTFPNGAGLLMKPSTLVGLTEERIEQLTRAEEFTGSIVMTSGQEELTGSAARLNSFPGLGLLFQDRPRIGLMAHLRGRFPLLAFFGLLLLCLGSLGLTSWVVYQSVSVARLKSDFVAAVSHEFKSPLASIQALLERLSSGRARDPEMVARYYGILTQEVHRLDCLVSRVLDFSQLEQGRRGLRLENADLAELTRKTVEGHQRLSGSNRVTFTADGPVFLQVDPGAVSQCLENLFENAEKYSPPDSAVEVQVGSDSEKAWVEVADQGIGIAPAEQKRIFEQFYRSPKTQNLNVKGAGLGLALVWEIMQKHGGSVTVESELNRGSAFRLVFPVSGTSSESGPEDLVATSIRTAS